MTVFLLDRPIFNTKSLILTVQNADGQQVSFSWKTSVPEGASATFS